MKIYSPLSEIPRKGKKKRTSRRSKSQQAPAEHIDFTIFLFFIFLAALSPGLLSTSSRAR